MTNKRANDRDSEPSAQNDEQKNRSRFPAGMTNKRANDRDSEPSAQNDEQKNRSRFPAGMTNKEPTTEILSLRLRMTSKKIEADSLRE